MVTEFILTGLLVFQSALFYMDRKRMTNMVYSRTTTELKQVEGDLNKPHTNIVLEQRRKQEGGYGE